jgi:hypothetical protein
MQGTLLVSTVLPAAPPDFWPMHASKALNRGNAMSLSFARLVIEDTFDIQSLRIPVDRFVPAPKGGIFPRLPDASSLTRLQISYETRSFISHRKVSYLQSFSIMLVKRSQHGTGLRPFPTCSDRPNVIGKSWAIRGRVGESETCCATPLQGREAPASGCSRHSR